MVPEISTDVRLDGQMALLTVWLTAMTYRIMEGPAYCVGGPPLLRGLGFETFSYNPTCRNIHAAQL